MGKTEELVEKLKEEAKREAEVSVAAEMNKLLTGIKPDALAYLLKNHWEFAKKLGADEILVTKENYPCFAEMPTPTGKVIIVAPRVE